MSNAAQHHKINYIEFFTTDVERTKKFYSTVFRWDFQDWGSDYISFSGAGIDGGFRKAPLQEGQRESGPLVVLYSDDLAATEAEIIAAEGSIVVPTFEFPGGRRFHFTDGVGNMLAVWSK